MVTISLQIEGQSGLTWPLWKQMVAAFLLGCVLLGLKLLIFGK